MWHQPPPEFPRRCSGTIQHLSRANTSGHSQNTINVTVDSKCTCPSINFDCACLKTRLYRTILQGDMFHFVDDSHPRDARHSQSVMTEESQKLRVKFVLHFPTCVSKTKTINLCRHQKCQALKSHPQSYRLCCSCRRSRRCPCTLQGVRCKFCHAEVDEWSCDGGKV